MHRNLGVAARSFKAHKLILANSAIMWPTITRSIALTFGCLPVWHMGGIHPECHKLFGRFMWLNHSEVKRYPISTFLHKCIPRLLNRALKEPMATPAVPDAHQMSVGPHAFAFRLQFNGCWWYEVSYVPIELHHIDDLQVDRSMWDDADLEAQLHTYAFPYSLEFGPWQSPHHPPFLDPRLQPGAIREVLAAWGLSWQL